MDILGIGYLGFETPSPESWKEYGPEVLGLVPSERKTGAPGAIYLRMDDADYRLAFHPGKINRIAYIGWEVPGRDEYRAALARFKEKNVDIRIGEKELCELRGVREVACFRDPAGYEHELFYAPKTKPGSFSAARPHSGFVAGEQGVGHVVLISPEPIEKLEQLFQEVMGFKFVTFGFGGGSATFLNPKRNPRSHCIAYAHIPDRMGIHHFGMPVSMLDELGVTYDIVRKRQDALQSTLGRHTQDPVVSFYHYTPGGFLLETFWEERPWSEAGPISQVNPHELSIWGHESVRSGMAETIRPVSDLR